MPGLAANFTPAAPAKGKTACKLALQRKLGLREDESAPIIACVSRLVGHKGFSLVTDVLHQIMEMDVQMVVLGTGDWQYEEAFQNAQRQYPGRFSAQITYSGPLSNMIYAKRGPVPHALHQRAMWSEPDDRHAFRHGPHRP